VGILERRFDALAGEVTAGLSREAGSAFERACRPTRSALKVLSAHVLGPEGASGPLPALVPRDLELGFALPLPLAALFLDGLVQIGRGLDRLAGTLREAGWEEPDAMGRAIMSSIADFWAYSFVHLKLPLWQRYPDLDPVLGLDAGSRVQRVASARPSSR
jgi:hypothetical protein